MFNRMRPDLQEVQTKLYESTRFLILLLGKRSTLPSPISSHLWRGGDQAAHSIVQVASQAR